MNTMAKTAKSEKMESAIGVVCGELDAAKQRGQFDILGRVSKIVAAGGELKFGKDSGPVIAMLQTGGLVFLTEWQQLPPIAELLDEACASCRVVCDECKAGKRQCTRNGCGGTGKLRIRTKLCPGCLGNAEIAETKADCKQCRGRGEVHEDDECPACEGTGKEKCGLCAGTGYRGSGTERGSKAHKAPTCKTCDGTGHKRKLSQQTPEKHLSLRTQGYVGLGPIEAIIWRRMDHTATVDRGSRFGADPESGGASRFAGEPGKKDFVVCDVEPNKDGVPMLLIMKKLAAGQPMYLLGGSASIRQT